MAWSDIGVPQSKSHFSIPGKDSNSSRAGRTNRHQNNPIEAQPPQLQVLGTLFVSFPRCFFPRGRWGTARGNKSFWNWHSTFNPWKWMWVGSLSPPSLSQGGERWNSDKNKKTEDQNHPKRMRKSSELSWRSRKNSTFHSQHLKAGIAVTPLRSCSKGEQFPSSAHLLFSFNCVLGAKKGKIWMNYKLLHNS